MKYYKKIQGKKCFLSPINKEDSHYFALWLNDYYTAQALQIADQLVGKENSQAVLEKFEEEGAMIFAVADNETEKLLGSCMFMAIDHTNRRAEAGIMIGDKSFRNKGYGTEAMQLLLDYGFNILNLNSIWLGVYSFNRNAVKSYIKCGFKEAGRMRQAKIIGGRKFDLVYMDILNEEFSSPYIGGLMESIKQ